MAKKVHEEIQDEEPKGGESYADGTPAMIGDLCLFQDQFQGHKILREGILVHIANGAGEMDGIVAYADAKSEMNSVVVITTTTKHVTIRKCQKAGLQSEF